MFLAKRQEIYKSCESRILGDLFRQSENGKNLHGIGKYRGMKWLKERLRNWLEVDRSTWFYTAEESKNAQIEFWKDNGIINDSEAQRLREKIHTSDKSRLWWESHPSSGQSSCDVA